MGIQNIMKIYYNGVFNGNKRNNNKISAVVLNAGCISRNKEYCLISKDKVV